LAAQQDIPTIGGCYGVAIADVNGDGAPDIIVTDNPGITVLLNTTAPGAATVSLAAPQNFSTAGGAEHVAVGDLNGDGKPDLAVANQSSNSATILLNTTVPGATTVAFATTSLAVGNGTYRVGIQDMNGDGKPDVTLITFGVGSANILEFFNRTAPGATTASFSPAQPLTTNHPHRLAFADLNGDGRPDLILPTQYSSAVSVALNTPATITTGTATGTISESVQFASAAESLNENAGMFSIPVSLAFPSSVDATVPFTLGGTALAGTNFSGVTASPLVIPAGQTSAVITGTLIDDGKYDVAKTLTLTLGTPTNATLGAISTNTLTIQNVEPAPTVSFAGVTQTVNEPTGGGLGTLDQAFDPSGSITLSAGFGGINTNQERAQTFQVGRTGTLTEIDVYSRRVSAPGGNFMIEVRRTDAAGAPSNDPADLLLQKAIPSANIGTAEAFLQVDISSANVQVSAGQTLAIVLYAGAGTPSSVTYQWNGQDTNPYPLGGGWEQVIGNHTWGKDAGTNEDLGFRTFVAAPGISNTFTATVKLSAASNAPTSIPFTLSGTAAAGVNYSGVTASPLVIPAGQTSGVISGTILDDGRYDTVNNTLVLTLGTPTNATLGAVSVDTITIQQSDPPPAVTFDSAAQTIMQNAGTFSESVRLSAASNVVTTVPFTLGGTAVGGTDYSGVTASPLVIPAGQTSATITGNLLINPAAGVSRTLTLTLGTPTNATLGSTATHTLTIQNSAAVAKLVISAPASPVAGAPFIVTVTALTPANAIATTYNGTIQLSSTDTAAGLPATLALTGGFGYFQATLKTAGSQTITATDVATPSLTGATSPLGVVPAPASRLVFSNVPATALTGSPVTFTITALDPFGNVVTGYAGHVHFTSSDAGAVLPVDATLTAGVGVFSATFKSSGSQTITALDTVANNPLVGGITSPVAVRGPTVSAFTSTPNGFTVAFSKPFMPAALTLFGTGAHTVQDVTLVGAHVGPISGSIIVDPSNASISFSATANGLALLNDFPVLPDDTYTATVVSGSAGNGFLDALGAGLDGTSSGGNANYTATFTTSYEAKKTPILSLPDFARGPDGAHTIKVPNDAGHGLPVTLSNAVNVTDATFTLSYNPTLLTVTGGLGGAGSDASNASSSFSEVGTPTLLDGTHAQATFVFHGATPRSGTIVLGDILANVPNSAAANYKAKELLSLGGIVINNGAVTGAVGGSSVHVNAYLGDVTGNGTIDGLDLATAINVAQGKDTGFAAYPLLDPAIVGDPALDFSVDAGDVSDLAAFAAHVPTPVIPALPAGLTITPVGADPTLSLGAVLRQGEGENGRQGDSPLRPLSPCPALSIMVPVLLDNPHPLGSTGMTEAILALSYDPKVLTVATSDITLGSIPGLNGGWRLLSTIDPVTGRIGIQLYGTTSLTDTQGGSLVEITFHALPGAALPATAVQLVDRAMIGGQEFTTQVDDAQGALVLTYGRRRMSPSMNRSTQRIGVRLHGA
jgi:hypothetical protein